MYISGNWTSFERRLHQLASNTGDLMTGYLTEGQNYTGQITGYHGMNAHWNQEFNKKLTILTQSDQTGSYF